MKKLFLITSLFLTILFIASCAEVEKITLSLSSGPIALEVGDEHQLNITTNDATGYDIKNSNDTVISVSSTGLVSALSEGTSIVTVTAKSDDSVSKEVTINVTQTVNLSIDTPTDYLWTEKTLQLTFNTNEAVTFKSSNVDVLTVDNEGLVTAVAPGNAIVTMALVSDPTVTTTIELVVYDVASTLILEGQTKLNIGASTTLNAVLGPETSAPSVIWEVNDETLATIDENGLVTAKGSGIVTITAIASSNDELTATHEIVVFNNLMVDLTKQEGDSLEVDDLTYEFGTSLFNSLDAALNQAVEGAYIQVYDLTQNTPLTIQTDGISIVGMTENVILTGKLTVDSNDFTISNIKFKDNAFIEAVPNVENITISHNTFDSLNTSVLSAIQIQEAFNVSILENNFTNLVQSAIVIDQVVDGALTISKNNINKADVAIKIAGSNYNEATTIELTRNEITNVKGAFDVVLDETEILAYARFNSVTNYTDFAAKSSTTSKVDFTLNYWGSQNLVLNDFVNIPEKMLLGHYENKSDIVSEADFDPTAPLFIFITSDLDTLWVNAEIQIEFEYLPYELKDARFRYRTTEADILMVTATGLLQPKQSGSATIMIDASHRSSDATDSIDLNVTTDPGIDLIPSIDTHSLISGDTVQIDAIPYPVTIKNSPVIFESSNTAVATVDQNGLVTSLNFGDVIITAKLADDLNVIQEYYLTFYDALDSNNLMDLITLNQQSFLKKHDFFETGTGPSYRVVGYESVSNYYFDEIIVDTSRMIPDAYIGGRVRPGYALSPIPAAYTTYNPQNVHWITVHDTANTDPSASALSHANYLLNQAANNGAQVSWHYTIDDYEMYQHIPEGEVAWHAGDGSNAVGSGSYLGGGNRNAIAIEMNVGMGDDLYRIWQRTAKFSAETLVKYNLPREHIKFHQHFSGKHCPNALLVSGLEPKFQKMADIEYEIAKNYSGAQITMESSNQNIVDNTGRVIAMPEFTTNVNYTVTIVLDGITTTRTFNVYVPGTTR